MSYVEEILYEALELGIRIKVIERVGTLQIKNPHGHLNDLYEQAFKIEKQIKENEDKHNS